ncbi:glycoside hydrolase family 57 protein [Myxococcota bacterium]|nr:glycoside hydrolase family 57 protein [Myxococcota bacterium]
MTRAAILWHHHQPDYRDPATGRPMMPWTRLHALRGYRDVGVALLESGAPMTVNLVPSLLDQLDWYAGGGGDSHLDLTRRPAADLNEHERAEILRTFIAGHPAMFDAWPGARRLKERRDRGEPFGVNELRDLQVWSTLAWVGWSGARDEAALKELRQKGAGFSEGDKEGMLAACERLVRSVMPLYRTLAQRGVAEISASPYYHPILPLLIDTENARRCLPDLPPDIPRVQRPEDALAQLIRGRERVERAVGASVVGLWPPEGAICHELPELAARAGFRWLVSDEGNLLRSERDFSTVGAPWDLGEGVVGFFRDRSISDDIGFRYARRPAKDAVDALLSACEARGGLVTIALDGENPWESFADAGEAFLTRLCEALNRGDRVRPVRFSEAAAEPVAGKVYALHTGSWVNSDLAIWFGDEEDRRGWALLAKAREAVAAAGDPPDALEHIYAAEGSDWFWWYGREFDTPFALDFDRLFRGQLAAAYRALGQTPPDALSVPVKALTTPPPGLKLPTRAIRPRVDGARRLFFEWVGAGYADCARPGGAMSLSAGHLQGIAWGLDDNLLHVRLDHRRPLPPERPGTEWQLVLMGGPETRTLRWPYTDEGSRSDGLVAGELCTELSLLLPPDFRGSLHVALIRDGVEVARYPQDGDVPVHLHEETDWWV